MKQNSTDVNRQHDHTETSRLPSSTNMQLTGVSMNDVMRSITSRRNFK